MCMLISTNLVATISKEELACICACIASIFEDKEFNILDIKRNQNKWVKNSREMELKNNQIFFKWR